MQLSSNDLLELCKIAISAAYKAGAVIREQSKLQVAVQSKKGGDSLASQVVTEVDFMCQDIILNSLLPTCEKFDLALLSEEKPDDGSRLDKDYFWCIDPLDGTLSFIDQLPGYAVSIALVSRSGIPQIGVIYDPVEQTLYHAIIDQGAYRNERLWSLRLSTDKNTTPLTVVCDRSFLKHSYYEKVMNELENVATEFGYDGVKQIPFGGAVMNACMVLENNPACYFKFPKPLQGGGSFWDFSATVCLFSEIGASVSDVYGKDLELNRKGSSFMNQQGVIYASSQELTDWVRGIYKRVSMSEGN